jgi:hypothetical protein
METEIYDYISTASEHTNIITVYIYFSYNVGQWHKMEMEI